MAHIAIGYQTKLGYPLPMVLKSLRLAVAFAIGLLAVICFGRVQKGANVSYKLAPEDGIAVTVLSHSELSAEYFIPQDGDVEFLGVGKVHVTGLSLSQLSSLLRKDLSGRVLNPEVYVTLKLPRIQRVFVYGDVAKPASYDIRPGWGIKEILSLSGGLALGVEEKDAKVILDRPSENKVTTVSLSEALGAPNDSKWIFESGDSVKIEGLEYIPVYVTGEVKSPGLVRLRADHADALAAVAAAGGALPDAAPASAKLVRLSGDQEAIDLSISPDGKPKTQAKVKRGDMIIVPVSQDRVIVLGYVAKPGSYPIPSGVQFTLAEVLSLAQGNSTLQGGYSTSGRLTRVGLLRFVNGKEVRRVVDLVKFLKTGDVSQNPILQPADIIYVPETNHVPPATILTAISSFGVLLSGIKVF